MVLNVQHDCERGDCTREPLEVQTQERQKTSRAVETIKHSPDGRYIVNMHVLHNPHILRKLFDRESYSIPAIDDRVSLHKKCASQYRALQAKKSKGKNLGIGVTNVGASMAEGSGAYTGNYHNKITDTDTYIIYYIATSNTSAVRTHTETIVNNVPGKNASDLFINPYVLIMFLFIMCIYIYIYLGIPTSHLHTFRI